MNTKLHLLQSTIFFLCATNAPERVHGHVKSEEKGHYFQEKFNFLHNTKDMKRRKKVQKMLIFFFNVQEIFPTFSAPFCLLSLNLFNVYVNSFSLSFFPPPVPCLNYTKELKDEKWAKKEGKFSSCSSGNFGNPFAFTRKWVFFFFSSSNHFMLPH